jgi:hypothetical protein
MRLIIDSHGWFWTPCDATHPAAQAFGPTGISRPCRWEGARYIREALDMGKGRPSSWLVW